MVLWIMLNLSKGKYQRSLCHGIANLPSSSSSTIRVVIFPGPGPSMNLQRPGHYTTLWLCWRSWISKSKFSPIQLRTIKSQQFGDFGNVRIGSTCLIFVNSSILYFFKNVSRVHDEECKSRLMSWLCCQEDFFKFFKLWEGRRKERRECLFTTYLNL